MKSNRRANVLLYPCNLVVYARLAILAGAIAFVGGIPKIGSEIGSVAKFGVAAWLSISVIVLDLVDGYLARRLGHETPFGTLLDLATDLLTHAFVWRLSGLSYAFLFVALEWTQGLYAAAFSLRSDQHWKTTLLGYGPWLVRVYFGKGRLRLLSGYSNLAHFLFPISLYLSGRLTWLGLLSMPGLVLFELVTLFMLLTFARVVVSESRSA